MKFRILCLFFLPFSIVAQPQQPKPSLLFDDTVLPIIEITIDPLDLNFILDPANEASDEEFSADFKYTSSSFSADEENIGFRLRGNTSRSAAKKSFKISFNAFEKGRDLDGFEKLNLNGEHNDPTMVRAKLGWSLMNSLEIPSSRANHVELYINDKYYGLYTNVEHIDEEFVEEYFGNKEGNLFKCLYPADLNYKGSNPELYKEVIFGRRAYELKTNEEEDDYSGLANFIRILNQTTDAQFAEQIESIFDVETYIKALAVEVLVAHWDNYSFNQNNFYLYENLEDGKFYYLPYDLDNTLGVNFFNFDEAEQHIYTWFESNANRPLTQRILSIEKYREQFSQVIYRLLNNEFHPDNLIPRISTLKTMIQDAAERDQYRTQDYGFSITDFNNSFTERLNQGHVRYGLTEFIEKRHQTATAQLDEITILTSRLMEPSFEVYPNPSTGHFTVKSNEALGTVQIINLIGQTVFEGSTTSHQLMINHQLVTGRYVLIVKNQTFDLLINK